MAERRMLVCDSCGKVEGAKVAVLRFDAKFGDGTRIIGDLCEACRKRMAKEFGLTHTSRQRRSEYQVVNYEDIPGVK